MIKRSVAILLYSWLVYLVSLMGVGLVMGIWAVFCGGSISNIMALGMVPICGILVFGWQGYCFGLVIQVICVIAARIYARYIRMVIMGFGSLFVGGIGGSVCGDIVNMHAGLGFAFGSIGGLMGLVVAAPAGRMIQKWSIWNSDADEKSAQQVDSAEASTIAVPPSELSGSPR